MRQIISIVFLLTTFMGCIVNEKSQRRIKFTVQAGLNHGGITENTDLSIVPGAKPTPESTIDAYSGATRIRAHAGVHLNQPLRYGEIETGIDVMQNHQIFTYADQGNLFIGVRNFRINQILFPITYNFDLFSHSFPESGIQLKLGYSGQYSFIDVSDAGLTALPEYSLNRWSNGAIAGISAFPVQFSNGSKLGLYLDVYRGSRIYTDHYNRKDFEMPGSSFVKFGLKYQFSPIRKNNNYPKNQIK